VTLGAVVPSGFVGDVFFDVGNDTCGTCIGLGEVHRRLTIQMRIGLLHPFERFSAAAPNRGASYKVCLIDLDPQASTTTLCGYVPDAEVTEDMTVMPIVYGEKPDLADSPIPSYWPG
jgi:hypothetical protein